MKRLAAMLVLLASLAVTGTAQEAEKPLPEWRTVQATRTLLWPWFNKEARRFDVPPAGLIQLFAETAKVSVRYDLTLMERLAPTAFSIGEGAAFPTLFDMCQLALSPRYTLLPDGSARSFMVGTAGDINGRATTTVESRLDEVAAGEWAFCAMALGGRDARVVERGLSGLRGISGRVEVIDNGRSLLVLDQGANLRRMRDFIPSLDREREPVPLVPYQRASTVNLSKLVQNLRGFIKLFVFNSGLDPERVTLVWEEQSGVVNGVVPRSLAATMDAAIEAAESAAARRKAGGEDADRRFVQFAISAPAPMDNAQFRTRISVLFDDESKSGDLHMTSRDEKSPTVYVRCRPWLEAEIKEAAELLSK